MNGSQSQYPDTLTRISQPNIHIPFPDKIQNRIITTHSITPREDFSNPSAVSTRRVAPVGATRLRQTMSIEPSMGIVPQTMSIEPSMGLVQDQYNDVSWSADIENNIKEIGDKSKGYKIMHIQQSKKIGVMYRRLMYAGIALGPLAGLMSGIGAIMNPSDDPVQFPVAATCLAFLSGIVVAITKYGKFEEKSSNHKLAASKYTSLESNVRRQLVLDRIHRVNAIQYLDYVGGNFDELFSASPLVESGIYNNYVKVARANRLFIPDEYGLNVPISPIYKKRNVPTSPIYKKRNVSTSPIYKKTDKLTDKNSISDEKIKLTMETHKRNSASIIKTELNRFSDGRMEYELQRMMSLK